MIRVLETKDRGIAIDPNGILPIPGSHEIKTIDVLDLCVRADRTRHNIGDLVHITYGTVWDTVEGKDVPCLRIICFIGDRGRKILIRYPIAATLFSLKKFFEDGLAAVLGCDSQEMAEAIAEHSPWQ